MLERRTTVSDPAQNILITGAGSGVGHGLAEQLAGPGRHLLLVDLQPEGLEAARQVVSHRQGTASTHVLDVTRADQISKLLSAEKVDVLINNAGLQFVSPIEEFPENKWDLLLDVMLKGPFLMSRAALPQMRLRGFGRIIHIGSIHSLVASPFKSAYIAAKHGLLGLSKTVALETAGANITSNTICPAYVRTPLVDAQIAQQAKANGISEEEVIEKIMLAPMPKKAFITIEEIAAAVEFLISPLARNVTGQTIVIDGGWTVR
jgi:3-hydroxybutyrate dehydrogenase